MFRQTTLKSRTKEKKQSDSNETQQFELGEGAAEFAHDLVELIELQFQLLAVDLRDGKGRAVITAVLIAVSVMMFLGALPVLLFGAGWMLAINSEMTIAGSFLLVGAVAVAASGILAAVAYYTLTKAIQILSRSRRELKSNVRWIKHALKKLK